MKQTLALLLCSLSLAACQGIAPVIAPNQPIGYVSASQAEDVAEYVSAWEEAQEELATEDVPPSASVTKAAKLPAVRDLSVSDLWGRPLTSSGKGVTLQDEAMRQRLNDALDTTPLGGTARWESGSLNFLFIPNSPVYTPHHSGGRCRDGVFALYGDGFNDQRLRGLFCQTGPGADWLLNMYASE